MTDATIMHHFTLMRDRPTPEDLEMVRQCRVVLSPPERQAPVRTLSVRRMA